MLIGAALFAGGFLLCYFTRPRFTQGKAKVETTVKRVKPSLRNPLRTYELEYERFRSRDNNLLEPVKPKKKRTVSEVSNNAEDRD